MSNCIAIIHATRVAVAPVEEVFSRLWPEADVMHILDESLMRSMVQEGTLTPPMRERIGQLARFGRDGGADAILYSCSAFGKAIEAVQEDFDIPVLKPNEAMLEDALAAGKKIRVTATFQPTLFSVINELEEMAERRGVEIEPEACFVPGALEALQAGMPEKHDYLIAHTIANHSHCDVALLSQFSMARALPKAENEAGIPVLSSPNSAVLKLRDLLDPSGGHSPAVVGIDSAQLSRT